MNHSDFLKGKVALITGSSSGIGAATARLFAKLGCAVSLTGRDENNLRKVQEECIEEGLDKNSVIYHAGNVTDGEFLKHLFNGTIEKFGKLDILVDEFNYFFN